jgi:prefoldin subunit 5
MNNDLDVNILVQTFNERMAQMMTEIVIKEATIKQLTAQIEQLTAQQKTVKTTKTKTEDFE